jgi:hypothetical protein
LKKIISILFLGLYLFTATEAGQLLKLPLLVKHFHEHTAENPTMNFYDYLCLHYKYADDHDKDQTQDSQLPFKSHAGCCMQAAIAIAVPPVLVYPMLGVPVFTAAKRPTAIYKDFFIPSSVLSRIWQPPKVC